MRDVVAAHLRAAIPNVRIVHELVCGSCRADIAAVSIDRIVLVELKSERDVLKRAEKQMDTFGRLAHGAVLVLDQKFFDRTPYNNGAARCVAPDGWERSVDGEVWHYPQPSPSADYGSGSLYRWQLPRPSLRQPRAFDFLGLLWRAELVDEAVRHRIDAHRKMDMVTIAAAMAWHMTGREIAEAVCRQLRLRSFPEADEPICETGARVTARSASNDLYREIELKTAHP
jgi:hypothetical protein